LDLPKRHWPSQRFVRGKIDRAPIALPRRWVGVSSPHDLGDAHDGFLLSAVVEKNFVAFAHPAQIISRGVIAHPGPARAALGNEIRPRVARWLLFHQPVILHPRYSSTRFDNRAALLQDRQRAARIIHYIRGIGRMRKIDTGAASFRAIGETTDSICGDARARWHANR